MNLHRSELVLQSTKKTKAFGLASHYKKMCNKRPQSHCVTAKECWHEQDYSRQGSCSFIFCSYFLVPCSSFFHSHYFLSSCFSCYFSPVILLLCIVRLPSIFLTVALLHLLICWDESLSLFLILNSFFHLFALCDYFLKAINNHVDRGPTENTCQVQQSTPWYKRYGMSPFWGVWASWLMQIRSDDISRRLGWMVWAPP